MRHRGDLALLVNEQHLADDGAASRGPLVRLRRICLSLPQAHAPERFFVPPYVGPSGWVGVWLDRGVVWSDVKSLAEDGYRVVAPKRLLGLHDRT